MKTHPKVGDSTPIILSQAVMRRMQITPDDSLDAHETELRHELGEALRYTLRAAIRMAVIKRAYFNDDSAGFVAWVQDHVGRGRRMAFLYVAAGRCLMLHADHFQELAACPLVTLEQLGKITSSQLKTVLSSHPHPEEMEVSEVKACIAGYLGKQCNPIAQTDPAPRQLLLPGLDELDTYDAATLDPYHEAGYLLSFVARTRDSLAVNATRLTVDQVGEIEQLVAGAKTAIAQMEARLSALHSANALEAVS